MKNIQEIVRLVSLEGGFAAVVLTDTSGFPLAASSAGPAAEAPAAIAAMIQRVVEQARAHLGLGPMHEVVMTDEAGQCVVCRWLTVGERDLILAVKAPPRVPYRRMLNHAAQRIKRAWDARLEAQK